MRGPSSLARSSAAAAALIIWSASAAAGQRVTYSGAVYTITGSYDTTGSATSVAFSTGLAVSTGRFRVSGSIPLIMLPDDWLPAGSTQRIGLGDPVVFASVDMPGASGGLRFYVSGGVKVPVAEVDAGFGSGRWDAGGGAGMISRLGRGMVLLDGMYWVVGDMPGVELPDGLSWSASMGHPLGSGDWLGIVSVFGASEAVPGAGAPLQAGGSLSRFTWAGRSISVSAMAGLTSAAPKLSLAIGWGVGL